MSWDLPCSGATRNPRDIDSTFTLLFSRYGNRLYMFALKITKSPEQSADIVQEVFLKLWEHRDEIDTIENMEGWLHRTAKNKLIDHIRKAAADTRLRNKLWSSIE